MHCNNIENKYKEKLQQLKLKMRNMKINNNVRTLKDDKWILTYDKNAFWQSKKEYDLLKLEYLKWKYEINTKNNSIEEVRSAWEAVLDNLKEDIEKEKQQRSCKIIVKDKNNDFQYEYIQDENKIYELTKIYEDEKLEYEKWIFKNGI